MRNSPVLAGRAPARRTAAPVAALAALATVLVLGGCGSNGDDKATDPAAETTSATPTTSAPVEPAPSVTATTEPATPDPDALITLETPADGATVSGSFEAKGTANSPEANVPWRILDAGGKSVLEGYFTAEGWMDKLYPYAGTVDVSKLAAGSYTFEVSIDDPSGGEGKAPQKVTHAITVQ